MRWFLMTMAIAILMVNSAFAAETALTVTALSETAAAIPYEDCDNVNGNSAANANGDLFFLLYNADGANSATVTITAQQTSKSVSGWGTLTKSNNEITLTAEQRKMVGPFRARAWNDSDGNVILSYSGDASTAVDVAALRVPAQ